MHEFMNLYQMWHMNYIPALICLFIEQMNNPKFTHNETEMH